MEEPAVLGECLAGAVGIERAGFALRHGAVCEVDRCAQRMALSECLLDDVPDCGLLLLEIGDLPAGVRELPGEPLLEGAQLGETLDRQQIGHAFDSMIRMTDRNFGG